MPEAMFKVTRGNPTETELAALTAVLSRLDAEARAKAAQTEVTRDNWGKADHFNPSAFLNVRYY